MVLRVWGTQQQNGVPDCQCTRTGTDKMQLRLLGVGMNKVTVGRSVELIQYECMTNK